MKLFNKSFIEQQQQPQDDQLDNNNMKNMKS